MQSSFAFSLCVRVWVFIFAQKMQIVDGRVGMNIFHILDSVVILPMQTTVWKYSKHFVWKWFKWCALPHCHATFHKNYVSIFKGNSGNCIFEAFLNSFPCTHTFRKMYKVIFIFLSMLSHFSPIFLLKTKPKSSLECPTTRKEHEWVFNANCGCLDPIFAEYVCTFSLHFCRFIEVVFTCSLSWIAFINSGRIEISLVHRNNISVWYECFSYTILCHFAKICEHIFKWD